MRVEGVSVCTRRECEYKKRMCVKGVKRVKGDNSCIRIECLYKKRLRVYQVNAYIKSKYV